MTSPGSFLSPCPSYLVEMLQIHVADTQVVANFLDRKRKGESCKLHTVSEGMVIMPLCVTKLLTEHTGNQNRSPRIKVIKLRDSKRKGGELVTAALFALMILF